MLSLRSNYCNWSPQHTLARPVSRNRVGKIVKQEWRLHFCLSTYKETISFYQWKWKPETKCRLWKERSSSKGKLPCWDICRQNKYLDCKAASDSHTHVIYLIIYYWVSSPNAFQIGSSTDKCPNTIINKHTTWSIIKYH